MNMLGQVFKLIPEALILVDHEGRILQSNAQADEMFGYEEGLAGTLVEDLLPDAVRGRHSQHRAEYMASPRLRPMGVGAQALAGKRRNGVVFPVEIALSPVEQSGPPQFLASIRDVSESRRERQAIVRARYDRLVARFGELALLASHEEDIIAELPARIAESLGVEAVAVLSLRAGQPGQPGTGKVTALPGHVGLDGAPADLPRELVSMRARVIDDLETESADEMARDAWAGGFRSLAMVPLVEWGQATGSLVALSRRPRSFDHDAVHCLQSIANLVSGLMQRRQAEERLAHSQRLEAVGKLTGGIAHDFNNLLTVISGNLQLLELNGNLPAESAELIEAVLRAVDGGAALTSKLLAFARRQRLTPRRLDPAVLLRGFEGVLQRTLGEHVQVAVHCESDSADIHVDSAQLESALLNLCLNARDAMPRGGRLTLAARNVHLSDEAARLELAPGRYLNLSVQDTGLGMSPEVLAQAFEPFFTTKDAGKGNGLGLSMVYGFVRQSGGQVRASSRLGYGTRIDVYFPVAAIEQPAPEPGAQVDSPGAMGETVLVVEDDPAVRRIAVAFLESLGYIVTSVADAEAALEVLERDPRIALVFADVALGSGKTGIELAAIAKARWPHLRVLLTSGHDRPAETHAELLAETDLLPKPYRREDLAIAVRRQFEQRGSVGQRTGRQ